MNVVPIKEQRYLGEWRTVSNNITHREISIHLIQINSALLGFKSNGNDYVGEGELSFIANIKTSQGKLKVAEQGGDNPRFVPCRFYTFHRSIWLVWCMEDMEYSVNYVSDDY